MADKVIAKSSFLDKIIGKTAPATIKSEGNPMLLTVVIALLIVSPFIVDDYVLGVLITILSSAYLAQCWNLMSGYAGQFSFGHAAFFGLGAYTSSLLYVDFGISPFIGMLAGAVAAGLMGLLIGYLSFRYIGNCETL